MHIAAMDELREPLLDLGRRWAASPHRPRPHAAVLREWDAAMDAWLRSSLPLILRDSRRRGERAVCSNGREVIFADNSPANWAFAMALAGKAPDIREWDSESIPQHVPLTFLTKGDFAKRDLNRAGWKVCHIVPVSDRRRYKIEDAEFSLVEGEFRRFLSPRNIFLIPKAISGAGELPEVISAIAEFEKSQREEHRPRNQSTMPCTPI